jgi:hypothetical protein
MIVFHKLNRLAKTFLMFVFATGFAAGNAVNADVVDSGACGKNNNLIWEFTDDGVLTIDGSGEMADYMHEHNSPWSAYSDDIVTIVFPNGLTSIGAYAFCDCKNLDAPIIPSSVTVIKHGAFSGSSLYGELVIPDNVTTIEQTAFWGCYFTKLTLGSSVTSLGLKTFAECDDLTVIVSRAATPPSLYMYLQVETFYKTDDNVSKVYVCGSDVAFRYKASDWGSVFGSSNIVNDCTQTGIADNTLSSRIIYPNPVSSILTVDCEVAGKVVVFDMSGREVLTRPVSGKTEIAVRHLPAGVYTVRLSSGAKVLGSTKLIKK